MESTFLLLTLAWQHGSSRSRSGLLPDAKPGVSSAKILSLDAVPLRSIIRQPRFEAKTDTTREAPYDGRHAITLPPEMAEEWPYEPRYKAVNGWRMHYIDEGPSDGEPILLLFPSRLIG